MDAITLHTYNDVYIQVECEPGIARELSEYFSFSVPGAHFMPAFRNKIWDGKIRLFNTYKKQIYKGLIPHIFQFAQNRGYVVFEKYQKTPLEGFAHPSLDSFITSLKLHDLDPSKNTYHPIKLYEHQHKAVKHVIDNSRCLILSPTGSGKSLIIYTILQYYQTFDPEIYENKKKILIIVPTISLVHQMFGNFKDYSSQDKSWDVNKNCHMIHQGCSKTTKKTTVISTWQSIYQLPKKWFEQFHVVFGDECLYGDSLITMADSSSKQIKNIKNKEFVKTLNEKNNKIENKQILNIHRNLFNLSGYYKIELENGKSIKITGNHKVKLKNGSWKRVDELYENDDIVEI